MAARIVILGSSFAGLTAAHELRRRLGPRAEITVVSPSRDFLFMPSLIWVPFGLRRYEQIAFPVSPLLEKEGIRLVRHGADAINLQERRVHTRAGHLTYDFLVIATGPKLDYAAIPGLGPVEGHTQSIFTWDHALRAGEAFERLVENPGPVVIGAVQGASYFSAAYEFLLNMAYHLRKRGLASRAPLTFVTSEPYLAHFGMGGFGSARKMTEAFFSKLGIESVTNAAVREIRRGEIQLADGARLPFSYAMLAPAFAGVDVVRACRDITNAAGFVEVNARYQTLRYPEVFAAGVAVAIDPPEPTPIPCGVPKTGYLSEEMARVAAHNIAAAIEGRSMISLPATSIDAKGVLDAGNTGFIMTADHFLDPREHAWLIPGPEAHWAKVAFEKYFMSTRRHAWH